jgi:hypothetical protein
MPSSSTILALAALSSAVNAVRVNSAPYNAALINSVSSNETIVTSSVITTTVEITTTLTTPPAPTVTLPPLSEVTVCPEPTGIAQIDVPEPNMQYGCSAGFVCAQPKPEECNVWPGLPSQDFTCDPVDCIPAPPLPEHEWPEGEIGYVAPAYGYFDLNPEIFGLSYDIFAYRLEEQVINGLTVTVTTGNWDPTAQPRPTGVVRRHLRQTFPIKKRQEAANPSNPAPQCYGFCNDSGRLAQQIGLEPELCTEQRWLPTYNRCVDCIIEAGSTRDTIRVYVQPQFQRSLTYCFGDLVTTPGNATTTAGVPADAITESATFDTSTQLPVESTGFVDTTTDISTEVTTTEDISTSVSTSISTGATSSEADSTTITTVVTETETSAVTETPGTVTTSFSTSLPPFPTPVPTPTPGVPAAAVRITASSTFAAVLLGIVAMLL